MTLEERLKTLQAQREQYQREAQAALDRLTGAILLVEQMIQERDAAAPVPAPEPASAPEADHGGHG